MRELEALGCSAELPLFAYLLLLLSLARKLGRRASRSSFVVRFLLAILIVWRLNATSACVVGCGALCALRPFCLLLRSLKIEIEIEPNGKHLASTPPIELGTSSPYYVLASYCTARGRIARPRTPPCPPGPRLMPRSRFRPPRSLSRIRSSSLLITLTLFSHVR